MEAINSMASAAAKAVWGEGTKDEQSTATTTTGTTTTTTDTMNNETQGQEPVSGKQGDTTKGEPFDAGNIETGTAPAATTEDTTTASKGPTADHPSTTSGTGFKAAQADIRDPETSATTDPKTEAERKNVDDSGEGVDASENPAKVDGPGPRPVEEVAKEHGGDAGASGDKVASADPGAEAKEEDEGKEKGSGEKYVKSSGLAADGGDFDATKPGAGREADRLLEEKGVTNPAAAAAGGKKSEDTTTSTESPEGKEKKSLKDKIKAKLHKN